jgi:hypothetical protein
LRGPEPTSEALRRPIDRAGADAPEPLGGARPLVVDAHQRQRERETGPAIGSQSVSHAEAAALPSSVHLTGADASGLAARAIEIACLRYSFGPAYECCFAR